MITQKEVNFLCKMVQSNFNNLSDVYEELSKHSWDMGDTTLAYFKDLKACLMALGTFYAGKVCDFSQLFLGWTMDGVDAESLNFYGEDDRFKKECCEAINSIKGVSDYFSSFLEE